MYDEWYRLGFHLKGRYVICFIFSIANYNYNYNIAVIGILLIGYIWLVIRQILLCSCPSCNSLQVLIKDF